MLEKHPFVGGLIVLTGVVWLIFLFWPDIKQIRIVRDPAETAASESPGWLYVFAFASLLAVGVWGASIYYSAERLPTVLTADEFAQSDIHGKRFRLVDLVAYSGSRVIEGRTFEDCWLYGPAVVLLGDKSDLGDSRILAGPGGLEVAFIVVPLKQLPDGRVQVPDGVIAFKDCKFRRCHLSGVGFIVTSQEKLEEIRQKNVEVPPSY